jgi:hypothetical protein
VRYSDYFRITTELQRDVIMACHRFRVELSFMTPEFPSQYIEQTFDLGIPYPVMLESLERLAVESFLPVMMDFMDAQDAKFMQVCIDEVEYHEALHHKYEPSYINDDLPF